MAAQVVGMHRLHHPALRLRVALAEIAGMEIATQVLMMLVAEDGLVEGMMEVMEVGDGLAEVTTNGETVVLII